MIRPFLENVYCLFWRVFLYKTLAFRVLHSAGVTGRKWGIGTFFLHAAATMHHFQEVSRG